MEQAIAYLNDITYMSELTPHPANKLHSYGFLGVGLIRANNLLSAYGGS